MRPFTRALILGFLLILTGAVPAYALWGVIPNDKPVETDSWPKPIVKGMNSHRRVYGAGSWDFGWTFYFVGNTNDINKFLAQLAEDKDTILEVVLVAEPGTENVGSVRFGEQDLKIDYSWSLHLFPYRDHAWIESRDGETEEELQKRYKVEQAKLPEFKAIVEVHCHGAIDAATLKIPLRFKASVGGKLAKLVEFHNDRRQDLISNKKSLSDEKPSDMTAAEAQQSLFTDEPADTQPSSLSPSTKPATGDGGEAGKK